MMPLKTCLIGLTPSNRSGLPLSLLQLAGYAYHHGLVPRDALRLADFSCEDSDAAVVEWVVREQPTVVGFSVYTWNALKAYRIAEALKQRIPAVRVVFGGPEVSPIPSEVFSRCSAADFIVVGEGEQALVDLLASLGSGADGSGIAGICHRDGPRLHLAPRRDPIDLDKASFPWELLSEELKCNARTGVLRYEASRGCPFTCHFCSWDVSGMGRTLRNRSVERIAQDIRYFFSLHEVNLVAFCDSDLLIPAPRAKAILEAIMLANRERRNRGWPTAGIRLSMNPELLDDDLVRLLGSEDLGFSFYVLGLQTANPPAVLASQRVFNREKYAAKFMQLQRSVPRSGTTIELIYGLPGDDYEGFKHSIEYALELGSDLLALYHCAVLPGTPFAEEPARHGITYDRQPPYDIISTDTWSADDVQRANWLARRIEFFHNQVDPVRQAVSLVARDTGTRQVDWYERLADHLADRLWEIPERPFSRCHPRKLPFNADRAVENAELKAVFDSIVVRPPSPSIL